MTNKKERNFFYHYLLNCNATFKSLFIVREWRISLKHSHPRLKSRVTRRNIEDIISNLAQYWGVYFQPILAGHKKKLSLFEKKYAFLKKKLRFRVPNFCKQQPFAPNRIIGHDAGKRRNERILFWKACFFHIFTILNLVFFEKISVSKIH